MTLDFEKRTVICALRFRFRKKWRRKLWVHPISSQRLLKGHIHERYENLLAYSKNKFIFHFNIKFLCITIAFFTTFNHCESTKKASGLDPIVDAECRTENIPEWLFGSSCARSSLFTFFHLLRRRTLRKQNGGSRVFKTTTVNWLLLRLGSFGLTCSVQGGKTPATAERPKTARAR